MKNRFLYIFAILSFLALMGLIVFGLISSKDMSERGIRLFSLKTASSDDIPITAQSGEDEAASGSDNDDPESASEDKASEDSAGVSDNKAGDLTVSGEDVPADTEESEAEDVPEREVLPRYYDLLDINPYVSGWLTIEGLGLDEPVVYTPNSQNYFLHRSIDGKEQERGSLFIAVNWQDGYNNTLIYGHNMKDGSSFGALNKYEDPNFGRTHTKINFDSLYEENEYELAAVFLSQIEEDELETESDRENEDEELMEASLEKKKQEMEEKGEDTEGIDESSITLADLDLYSDMGDVDIYREEKDEDDGRFRYYYYTDLSDKADFDYFVEHVKENALYDTGVDMEWGDELLTLSTCNYHVKNGRLIIVAKKVRKD